jgi:hypothetical protein
MAIRVQHQPSAATIADAAFQVGRGEKKERNVQRQHQQALQAAQLEAQKRGQDIQAQIAMMGIAQRNLQFQQGLEHDKEMMALRQEFNADMFRMEQEARLQDFALKNPGHLDHQAIRSIYEANAEPEFTPQQESRRNELKANMEWLQQQMFQGTWSPEEANALIGQMQAEYDSIQPAQKKSSAEQHFFERTVNYGGSLFWIDDKGNAKDITPKPVLSFSDYARLYSEAHMIMTTRGPNGKDIPPSEEEVARYVNSLVTGYGTLTGNAVPGQNPSMMQTQAKPTPTVPQETMDKVRSARIADAFGISQSLAALPEPPADTRQPVAPQQAPQPRITEQQLQEFLSQENLTPPDAIDAVAEFVNSTMGDRPIEEQKEAIIRIMEQRFPEYADKTTSEVRGDKSEEWWHKHTKGLEKVGKGQEHSNASRVRKAIQKDADKMRSKALAELKNELETAIGKADSSEWERIQSDYEAKAKAINDRINEQVKAAHAEVQAFLDSREQEKQERYLSVAKTVILNAKRRIYASGRKPTKEDIDLIRRTLLANNLSKEQADALLKQEFQSFFERNN